jgi:hypothetical protein
MIRLLIEDVTLVKAVDIAVHVRFKGGNKVASGFRTALLAREA